jgi:glutathione-regulated potassium-efflux system ancillary protein KefF
VPALLKLWMDLVLEAGWAYGPGGTALRGKSLLVVATTGGLAEAYTPEGVHGHPIEDFLLPLQQTAALCGMTWLAPAVLHDADNADDFTLARHLADIHERLGLPEPAILRSPA